MQYTAVWKGGNIKSLEIRITPGKSAEETAKNICYIDGGIQNKDRPFCFPQSSYYFVIYFTKCKDREGMTNREIFDERHCRHYTKRRELEKQANDIAYFREVYRRTASRVLGIDACSQEIRCRPEVMAVVFRFLREHTVSDIIGNDHVSQLRVTYHVGEDFLDVIDGLRAVDKAVHFLNLRCGDRIGHGTVLGIDVRKWYQFKQNAIITSQQDCLDNIVWLYYKLTEYNICGFDILKDELLKKFDHYFSLIHRNSVRENYIQESIQTYYEAWKLRGDEPELYLEKQFDKWDIYSMEWLVNRKYPEKYDNRKREEVSRLYYLYQYKWEVRKEGEKNVQIYISPMYVEAAVAVQKTMQKDIAARGIGIETNPSSNVASAQLKDMRNILSYMYNKDLIWNADELKNCPQINVSINTDDKGVFHTSLENEYALMACALENVKNEKGKPVYNRQMIYQWIDNVREMGNMQTFRDRRS